jgi:sterol desaturase/sphingolipid hydroxylase (fatty acid hydroxylase superfamily)
MKWTTLAIATGAFVLLALERVPQLRRFRLRVLRPHFWTDVVLLFVGFVAGGRLAMEYVGWAGDAIGQLGLPRLSTTSTPLWVTSAIAVVLLDFGNYVCHAAQHRFDTLWEFHKVHHSSRDLDWLATFRSHPIEQLVRRLLAPALLVAVGVPLDAVSIAAAVITAWARHHAPDA